MLSITIPSREFYDEQKNLFIEIKEQTITLEHSLVSVSKWESKWKIPFLSANEKTREQNVDYIRCMAITQNVNPIVFDYLSRDNVEKVQSYINDRMSATWFAKSESVPSREIITSERIYASMFALGIPMECQKWHLNRLLTLIKVCSESQKQPKKMGKANTMRSNKALNAARRKASGSKG